MLLSALFQKKSERGKEEDYYAWIPLFRMHRAITLVIQMSSKMTQKEWRLETREVLTASRATYLNRMMLAAGCYSSRRCFTLPTRYEILAFRVGSLFSV
jgi:hypothetical protein